MNLNDNNMFLYQFILGTDMKVKTRNQDTILVTCNIVSREDKNYLWGAEKYCVKICKALSKKYKVHLFQHAKNFLELDNVVVHSNIDNFFSKERMKVTANKVKAVAPKCILCNAGSGQQALYWTIIAKMVNVPIIMFFHNEPEYMLKTISNIWGMNYIKNQKVVKNSQKLYDMVLENCNKLAFLLPQYIDKRYEKKSYVFYNCVELPEYVDVEQERQNILYVGRINSDVKRTNLLIDAVKDTEYPCYICGYNYYGQGYIDMSWYEDTNIHYEGYQENVADYYKNAKMLVIPSLLEGLPTVALEAMSYGVPVLGFKECKSINDIVKDGYNGWVIENDLKRKISEIMSIEDMTEIRKNCIEESKKYSIEKIMVEIEKAIKSCR